MDALDAVMPLATLSASKTVIASFVFAVGVTIGSSSGYPGRGGNQNQGDDEQEQNRTGFFFHCILLARYEGKEFSGWILLSFDVPRP